MGCVALRSRQVGGGLAAITAGGKYDPNTRYWQVRSHCTHLLAHEEQGTLPLTGCAGRKAPAEPSPVISSLHGQPSIQRSPLVVHYFLSPMRAPHGRIAGQVAVQKGQGHGPWRYCEVVRGLVLA